MWGASVHLLQLAMHPKVVAELNRARNVLMRQGTQKCEKLLQSIVAKLEQKQRFLRIL